MGKIKSEYKLLIIIIILSLMGYLISLFIPGISYYSNNLGSSLCVSNIFGSDYYLIEERNLIVFSEKESGNKIIKLFNTDTRATELLKTDGNPVIFKGYILCANEKYIIWSDEPNESRDKPLEIYCFDFGTNKVRRSTKVFSTFFNVYRLLNDYLYALENENGKINLIICDLSSKSLEIRKVFLCNENPYDLFRYYFSNNNILFTNIVNNNFQIILYNTITDRFITIFNNDYIIDQIILTDNYVYYLKSKHKVRDYDDYLNNYSNSDNVGKIMAFDLNNKNDLEIQDYSNNCDIALIEGTDLLIFDQMDYNYDINEFLYNPSLDRIINLTDFFNKLLYVGSKPKDNSFYILDENLNINQFSYANNK